MTLRYQMDDCSITLPEGYRDRTMNVVEWKLPEGDTVVLMVQRDQAPALPPGAPPSSALERYVADQTRDYPRRFAGLKVERDEVASGDTHGIHLCRKAFRSLKDRDVLYHHQAFLLAGDTILVMTAAAHARHRARVDEIVDEALRDVRLRQD